MVQLSVVTGLRAVRSGIRVSVSCDGRDFLFSATFRSALGPTQPSIKWILGVKRSERKADHSSLFSAEVKNACFVGAVDKLFTPVVVDVFERDISLLS
jgi:hypothetical protein